MPAFFTHFFLFSLINIDCLYAIQQAGGKIRAGVFIELRNNKEPGNNARLYYFQTGPVV
jgi:hypothetical protein